MSCMYPYRTRFKKEIVAEFLPPARYDLKKKQKVVILCDGAPGVPKNRSLVQFFAKKGYWAIYPRYRGTWESDGKFLEFSLEKDLLDVIDQLPKGFKTMGDAHHGKTTKTWKIALSTIYVIGGSFGGPAAIFASKDPRVMKVVAISPVVEWRAPSKAEPMPWLEKFFLAGFGNGYRFSHKNWKKLESGKFYNPLPRWREFDGKKILIYHAKDDRSVRWNEVSQFAKLTHATIVLRKRGGHLGKDLLTRPAEFRRIQKFFRA